MSRFLILFLLLSTPAFAQDDCPPGHVRNEPLQPIGANHRIDHALMLAHFRASFVGIFGREPTMQAGAGKDDGEYYIGASDHYGLLGDDQCHAGWSGYWESWLQTGHGDLALAQTPARFQPSVSPPLPVPVPAPPPLPDPFLQSILTARFDRVDAAIAAVKQDVADFRESLNSKWAAILKSPYFQVIAGAVITWATTYKVMKP